MPVDKIGYQQITFSVSSAGQEVPIEVDTDKLYKKLTGVNVILYDQKNMFSTLQLDLDTVELYPEKWEVFRIMVDAAQPIEMRYDPKDRPAGGSKLKGRYIDVNSGATYPYTVSISLRLEND